MLCYRGANTSFNEGKKRKKSLNLVKHQQQFALKKNCASSFPLFILFMIFVLAFPFIFFYGIFPFFDFFFHLIYKRLRLETRLQSQNGVLNLRNSNGRVQLEHMKIVVKKRDRGKY